MTYTISLAPSTHAGKITAISSDGHTFTASEPLLTGARYWLDHCADPAATITTIWSSGPGHWAYAQQSATPPSSQCEKAPMAPTSPSGDPSPLTRARTHKSMTLILCLTP